MTKALKEKSSEREIDLQTLSFYEPLRQLALRYSQPAHPPVVEFWLPL
jgi:hypothetical protein